MNYINAIPSEIICEIFVKLSEHKDAINFLITCKYVYQILPRVRKLIPPTFSEKFIEMYKGLRKFNPKKSQIFMDYALKNRNKYRYNKLESLKNIPPIFIKFDYKIIASIIPMKPAIRRSLHNDWKYEQKKVIVTSKSGPMSKIYQHENIKYFIVAEVWQVIKKDIFDRLLLENPDTGKTTTVHNDRIFHVKRL